MPVAGLDGISKQLRAVNCPTPTMLELPPSYYELIPHLQLSVAQHYLVEVQVLLISCCFSPPVSLSFCAHKNTNYGYSIQTDAAPAVAAIVD